MSKQEEKKPKSPKFTDNTSRSYREGVDFYLENGLYVFTEKFLRERGFCCQSGCRHCPYGFKKEKLNDE